MRTWLIALATASVFPAIAAAQNDIAPAAQPSMPPPSTVEFKADRSNEIRADAVAPGAPGDRMTYVAPFAQRGTGTTIPLADIQRLCADRDGCEVRIAMYNWDGTGRTASREFLFFYNPTTLGWRASTDAQGFDDNNTVEHVNNSWACYFTDGEYSNWNGTDLVAGLQLLLWNEYNADCWLTIIE